MKPTAKPRSALPTGKKKLVLGSACCAPKKVTEVFEDCTITVQGNKVWMRGPLAKKLASVAQFVSKTHQEVFNDCIRMLIEFRGVRRVRKWGKPQSAIQLGKILKIKR